MQDFDCSQTTAALLAAATDRDDPVCQAVAGAIGSAADRALPRSRWLRGVSGAEIEALMAELFPRGDPRLWPLPDDSGDDGDPEFADLLGLLLEAATPARPRIRYLACAIASAALFDNHLWQDLQLPSRAILSQLLQRHFPDLAARNLNNMRWKAFFYKQLCERAGQVCRSPSCGACDDYEECFGSE